MFRHRIKDLMIVKAALAVALGAAIAVSDSISSRRFVVGLLSFTLWPGTASGRSPPAFERLVPVLTPVGNPLPRVTTELSLQPPITAFATPPWFRK